MIDQHLNYVDIGSISTLVYTQATMTTSKNHRRPFYKNSADATPTTKFKANVLTVFL